MNLSTIRQNLCIPTQGGRLELAGQCRLVGAGKDPPFLISFFIFFGERGQHSTKSHIFILLLLLTPCSSRWLLISLFLPCPHILLFLLSDLLSNKVFISLPFPIDQKVTFRSKTGEGWFESLSSLINTLS